MRLERFLLAKLDFDTEKSPRRQRPINKIGASLKISSLGTDSISPELEDKEIYVEGTWTSCFVCLRV